MLGVLKAIQKEWDAQNDMNSENVKRGKSETMKTINDLISDFCDLYNYPGDVTIQCKPYVDFKNNINDFIYRYDLQSSVEWNSIQVNLVTRTGEYVSVEEADIILSHLNSIQKKILSGIYQKEIESEKRNLVPQMIKKEKIFIVHGHDDLAKEATARFIEKLGLEAIILHEQSNMGKTIIEKIETNTDVDFGIVLYTPCDVGGKNKNELLNRARQNVVFEHGYLIAKLGRKNVVALVKGDVECPSDVSGIVYEPMDEKGAWKYAIATELKSAGFEIDMNRIG
ncbi:MAG: nucleotide-binding protein [Eubacteriales bacterium]